MKKQIQITTASFLLLCSLMWAPPVRAALSISWFTVDGGGGVSTSNDGRFKVSGTAGQPDASQQGSNDAQFWLAGGFWQQEIQFCGCVLSIAYLNGNVVVSWPGPLQGCILEYTDVLASPPSAIVWSPVLPQPSGLTYMFAPTGVLRYFRLRAP